MAGLYDQLTGLTVTVTSPDSNIKALVKGGTLLTVEFRANTYDGYRERGLEHQLARLWTLGYTGHQRGIDQVYAQHRMRVKRDLAVAKDAAERDYMAKVHSISVVGAGPSRKVRFKTRGMMNWQCRIADGTLAATSETEFIRECTTAIDEIVRKTAALGRLYKDEYFGRELSKEVRDNAIAELSAA